MSRKTGRALAVLLVAAITVLGWRLLAGPEEASEGTFPADARGAGAARRPRSESMPYPAGARPSRAR